MGKTEFGTRYKYLNRTNVSRDSTNRKSLRSSDNFSDKMIRNHNSSK